MRTPAESRERKILNQIGLITEKYYNNEINKHELFARIIKASEPSMLFQQDQLSSYLDGEELPFMCDDTLLPISSSGSFHAGITDTDYIENYFEENEN